jgi:hemolysin activation/secretion protein
MTPSPAQLYAPSHQNDFGIRDQRFSTLKIAVGILFATCLTSNLALAQTATDANEAARQAEILRRQQEQQQIRDRDAVNPANRAPAGIDTDQLRPKSDASLAGAGCRNIDQIALDGADNMPQQQRLLIAQKYAGQCLGVPEIENILAELTKYYVDRGLITTRAYLPSQDLKTGTLQILIVEGKIEKITVREEGRKSINPSNVFPNEGELLNLRDLEQGIDQVNKLSSNNASLDIQPGSEAGSSEVVIINKTSAPFRGSFSLDNQGSRSTGRAQLGLTLVSEGLLGLNELMMFTHRWAQPDDRASRRSVSDSLSMVVPFGYSTVSLSASRAKYVSTLLAPSGAVLVSNGDTSTQSFKWDRVMFRDQKSRFSLASGLTRKEGNNFLAGQFLGVSSRTLSIFDLDTSYTTVVADGVLSLDLGYSKGTKMLGALKDPAFLPASSPKAQFGKLRYGVAYSKPFNLAGERMSFSTQLTGQQAKDTLYGSEQILIGGLYTVRGFVGTTLSGDSGNYVRNDLSWLTSVSAGQKKIPLRLYTGMDFGSVRNRVPGIPQGRLVGMALGASMNFGMATLDISATRPVSAPATSIKEPTQYWLTLRFNF